MPSSLGVARPNDGSYYLPDPKKARIRAQLELPLEFVYLQKLLSTSPELPLPQLPKTLTKTKTRNNIGSLQNLMDLHGFRTSVVQSPRPALSIYKDSCTITDSLELEEAVRAGKTFLVSLFGLHPDQLSMEQFYSTSIKNVYCLLLFCHRLRVACPKALEKDDFALLVSETETRCRAIGTMVNSKALEEASKLSKTVPKRVARLTQLAIKAEPRNRIEQLEREYGRIRLVNSTLSNALVTLFTQAHDCQLKDIYLKRSHVLKYERITIYTYDPELDFSKPPSFLFLPSLQTAMDQGPHAIVQEMIHSFWSHLLRNGYFCTSAIKATLEQDLERFFLSGITKDVNIPLQLNAHFDPSSSLSFYLHGKAGAGKSSLVRTISPALEATIEEHVDPEILARFVKQNLNKRYDVLELELELRPNNNDLSVMSIIQGRRMTMAQSKPGLVVVDLEEMPSNDPNANPNQLKVSQLISQRFSGRSGEYKEETKAPRNSGKRGIQNDASLITLFTSNYELDAPCREALRRLEMFQNLCVVEMKAISGEDRKQFAHSYIQQCIRDRFSGLDPTCSVALDIPFGKGDTRPLVRHLRMIAFYICALVGDSIKVGGVVKASVMQKDGACHVKTGKEYVELKLGTLDNLFPLTPQVYDPRVKQAIHVLHEKLPEVLNFSELSIILDFWFARTLAPAVVVSKDPTKIKTLVQAIGALKDVHYISDVDAGEYKMMKSLYDPNNTPNLRDDILKYGRGSYVAIELQCPTTDSQLCVREIIEDSPSMTAFSTSKSALYKTGLLFAVYIKGDITPEVMSRVSLVLS